MKINSFTIGDEHPCFIIAEACDNHLGNMETAKEMALQAKLAGADAVKYQQHGDFTGNTTVQETQHGSLSSRKSSHSKRQRGCDK